MRFSGSDGGKSTPRPSRPVVRPLRRRATRQRSRKPAPSPDLARRRRYVRACVPGPGRFPAGSIRQQPGSGIVSAPRFPAPNAPPASDEPVVAPEAREGAQHRQQPDVAFVRDGGELASAEGTGDCRHQLLPHLRRELDRPNTRHDGIARHRGIDLRVPRPFQVELLRGAFLHESRAGDDRGGIGVEAQAIGLPIFTIAPCSTWDDTSTSHQATGRCSAGASTHSSPVNGHCPRWPPALESHAQRITAPLLAGEPEARLPIGRRRPRSRRQREWREILQCLNDRPADDRRSHRPTARRLPGRARRPCAPGRRDPRWDPVYPPAAGHAACAGEVVARD